jgi:hypothetical protein
MSAATCADASMRVGGTRAARRGAARALLALPGTGAAAQITPLTPAAAAALSAECCLAPDSEVMAARCELRHRYCAKAPNEAWRTRWRVVCGGAAAGAFSGTSTVDGREGRRAFTAKAEVIWLPKPGSRTEFTPVGTRTFTGKSRDRAASETVELGPADGEPEIKRGAQGAVTHYRGVGFKAMDIRVTCLRAAGVIAGASGADAVPDTCRGAGMAAIAGPPVAWFNTAADFRAVKDGQLQGELKDPDGIWTWR